METNGQNPGAHETNLDYHNTIQEKYLDKGAQKQTLPREKAAPNKINAGLDI